jgi:D-Tyr-tRNAtyr deacylase
MKAVIQRCTSASVTVDGKVISSIGRGEFSSLQLLDLKSLIISPPGILCLIGIGTNDTEHESKWLASKLLGMRLFPDEKEGENWGWKRSVVDAGYEVLCGEAQYINVGALDADHETGRSEPIYVDGKSEEGFKTRFSWSNGQSVPSSVAVSRVVADSVQRKVELRDEQTNVPRFVARLEGKV